MNKTTVLKRHIKLAIKGDSAAFERLICDFNKDILYNIRILIQNQDDEDDASQEVVTILYRNITKLKSPYAFYSYLQQVIRNVCVRANQKYRKSAHDDVQDYTHILKVDNREEPESIFDEKYEAVELRELLAQLPDRQRETVFLFYYKELSYKEIAKLQGISVNTVGVNMSKAKSTLKKLKEEQ